MMKLSVVALLVCAVLAKPVSAAPLLFEVTEPVSGISASFILDHEPIPLEFLDVWVDERDDWGNFQFRTDLIHITSSHGSGYGQVDFALGGFFGTRQIPGGMGFGYSRALWRSQCLRPAGSS